MTFGLVLLAGPAAAQSHFDYLEAGIGFTEFDLGVSQLDADIIELGVSTEYKNRFLMTAEYAQRLFDVTSDFEMKQDLYSLRLGYYFNVFRHVDLYAGIAYEGADSDLATGSRYDYGLGLALGLNSRPHANLEFDALLEYSGLKNPIALTGPKLTFTGQARWYFGDSLSVGFGGSFGEYETSLFSNFRFSFDTGSDN